MITRVRMSESEKQALQIHLAEQRLERQAEEWATELNWIYIHDNPICQRALELEYLLDQYWSDKPDWDEEELLEIQNMRVA
jgi:hypothetical protein